MTEELIAIAIFFWLVIGIGTGLDFIRDNYGSPFWAHSVKDKILAIVMSFCLAILGPIGFLVKIIIL